MAVAGQNTPLLDYPFSIGKKFYEIFQHTGPKSYGNIGTSSGTGDVIKALDLGWGGFDKFSVLFNAYSFSGNYIVKVFTSSSATTPALAPGLGGNLKVVLQWFTTSAAFGAISTEVTNTTDLSAETIQIEVVGE